MAFWGLLSSLLLIYLLSCFFSLVKYNFLVISVDLGDLIKLYVEVCVSLQLYLMVGMEVCLPASFTLCTLFNQATFPKILQTQMVSLGSLLNSVTFFLPFQLSAPRPCTPNQLPNHKPSGHSWSSDALPICLYFITCPLSLTPSVSTHFSNSDPHNFTPSH